MTTERDIRNQIRYAEKKGMEKGTEQIARRMLDGKMAIEKIVVMCCGRIGYRMVTMIKRKKPPKRLIRKVLKGQVVCLPPPLLQR